jgi:hypothetical protein
VSSAVVLVFRGSKDIPARIQYATEQGTSLRMLGNLYSTVRSTSVTFFERLLGSKIGKSEVVVTEGCLGVMKA